jgi:hypothetical protein
MQRRYMIFICCSTQFSKRLSSRKARAQHPKPSLVSLINSMMNRIQSQGEPMSDASKTKSHSMSTLR